MILPHDDSLDEFYYPKDKYYVFYKDSMFAALDRAAFKVLGLGYATDRKNIYFHTGIVKNADPATFRVFDHGFGDADAEDSNRKFLEGKKVIEN